MSERQWEVVRALLTAVMTAVGTALVNEALSKIKASPNTPAPTPSTRRKKARKP